MKKTLLALAMAGVVAGCSTPPETPDNPKLETTAEKVSYGMGLVLGERMSNDLPDLQMDQFLQGIQHGHAGDDAAKRLTREEIQEALMAYQKQMQEEQTKKMEELARKNKEAGDAFLAENAKKEGVQTTESGLQYEVIEPGSGAKPGADDTVKVHYTGELLSGEVFDSSRERGEPVTFALNQVIPGWTEGLQLMSEGARYKLYIPADLAYGPGGNRAIGPNETLIFDVELLDVNPGQEDGDN
ncbi:FKBP-type peptidyl-prolyl cis-trans isomerase [Marinobacter lutaoensis]|jgi:FKBP-type peptidyl-prolyl cis-trans isomerase FklB|uniref:Peptidyl-prolyl cis-trans isomerase n=1 Tax=Marinobacter lutaoensis TaxID=135739 RepID=A0A1V2DW83_9GAMM|nr:FKBP-type peptidyl-prolyl cis-trans isomerase [Marinobacter lutaoensis]MBE02151.1 peptidylprolyl isomerase [Marinobacter sp.]MBI44128.1 peptidylprolyl isomerase [Oceanospirillales bacterium]NVD36646.1 FKBP-type peptidyl-prolyl cis-trans isomerase [Marinobacter lutaoensis]ONF44797.1 peptidylprolyl isomerase [Marinobacter lutaoensis]|tara:strand:- start:2422 stop:3147 length:726 start_codon:yes stop_codon:yes gene_type:complete